MNKIAIFTGSMLLVASVCFALDLDEIGKTLEGTGVTKALETTGIDLNRITDYLDWETINISLISDMTSTTETLGRTVTFEGKVYKKGIDGLRINLKSGLEVPGKNAMKLTDCYVLQHFLQKNVYLIFPVRKAYVKINHNDAREMLGSLHKKQGGKPMVEKKEELGIETIDGFQCKKVHVLMTLASGTKIDTMAWLAEKLKGFPLKAVSSFKTRKGITGANTTLFSNIEEKEPDAELFSFPKDYTQYDNLMELATEGKFGKRLEGIKKRKLLNK